MNLETYVPSPEQVQKVIDTLESIAPLARKTGVRMSSVLIHDCGTPMCHAGWYGFANNKSGDYSKGVMCMMRDLGMPENYDMYSEAAPICLWAAKHPEIWGPFGNYMFSSDNSHPAFGVPSIADITIDVIINKWKDIKRRILLIHPPIDTLIAEIEPHKELVPA